MSVWYVRSALERSEKDKGDSMRANVYSNAANAVRDHVSDPRNHPAQLYFQGWFLRECV